MVAKLEVGDKYEISIKELEMVQRFEILGIAPTLDSDGYQMVFVKIEEIDLNLRTEVFYDVVLDDVVLGGVKVS